MECSSWGLTVSFSQVFAEKDEGWGLKPGKFKCLRVKKKPWILRAENTRSPVPTCILLIKMYDLAMAGVGQPTRVQFWGKPDPGSKVHAVSFVFQGTVKLRVEACRVRQPM